MPPQLPTSAATPTERLSATADAVLDRIVLGNSVHAWIIAGAILLVLVLAVYVIRSLLLSRLARIAKRTATNWDDVAVEVLRRVRFWLVFPALFYASTQTLVLPPSVAHALKLIAIIGVSIQLVLSSLRLVDAALEALLKRSRGENGEHDATVASSLSVLRFLALAVIAIVVVLVALDNLNVSITPMLTGLGVGGIAVALAVQNILGDLFGSLTIILDKPFVVGDFIIVGDKMGTVERIGVKTTRVRALSGEQLVFANSDLLSSRIQNFKRMFERRVVFTVGVIYETSAEHIRLVPEIIKQAVSDNPKARLDRCHFKSFGAYSLDVETVYFVTSPEFNTYMDIQQRINLAIFDKFNELGISFAYPTSVEIQRTERQPPAAYVSVVNEAAAHNGSVGPPRSSPPRAET